ncbi:MAG: hypothetical protein Q8893_02610, partial [Candidatus Phytoplasma australasiaticum]|nr:hypothetical protein [Candidatus Phytoplasma australasiaticum]
FIGMASLTLGLEKGFPPLSKQKNFLIKHFWVMCHKPARDLKIIQKCFIKKFFCLLRGGNPFSRPSVRLAIPINTNNQEQCLLSHFFL